MLKTIANEALVPEDIPPSTAPWVRLWEFALTFDGYGHWGSFEACAGIANARRHKDLTDLRTCLFFEQRRWRHFGEMPEGEDEVYIRGLVESISSAVAERKADQAIRRR